MPIACDQTRKILYAAVVATSMQISTVQAQIDAAAGMIEETIVTAQRVEQSVQDVPIAVTALSEIVLEARQIIGVSDLQLNTPNMSFSATNFWQFLAGYSRYWPPGNCRVR